jgi:glycosyltransferase involved in cell wall biosynthesis
MPELYAAADIFLNGSDIDNMPTSLIESFAAGLPVVTTDAGGIPYIVTDGATGLLVSKGDYESMAAAALRLLAEPAFASGIANNAYRECQKYAWDSVRDEWLKLYREQASRPD